MPTPSILDPYDSLAHVVEFVVVVVVVVVLGD
jgi:hypothetical protein